MIYIYRSTPNVMIYYKRESNNLIAATLGDPTNGKPCPKSSSITVHHSHLPPAPTWQTHNKHMNNTWGATVAPELGCWQAAQQGWGTGPKTGQSGGIMKVGGEALGGLQEKYVPFSFPFPSLYFWDPICPPSPGTPKHGSLHSHTDSRSSLVQVALALHSPRQGYHFFCSSVSFTLLILIFSFPPHPFTLPSLFGSLIFVLL